MPPTTENIPDKAPFDVYAMLLVLSCIFTIGASALLFNDLSTNWGFWTKKEDANAMKRATHITQMNDDETKYPFYVKLRKEDVEDYKIIHHLNEFPFGGKEYQWPEGYDPLANPVIPYGDNLQIPEETRKKLLEGYNGPTEGAAPATAPATDAPKSDAPKTDTPAAPKADAPAAPGEKAAEPTK